MIRVLRVAGSTAIKARTQAINALRSLLVTAPPELRRCELSRPAGWSPRRPSSVQESSSTLSPPANSRCGASPAAVSYSRPKSAASTPSSPPRRCCLRTSPRHSGSAPTRPGRCWSPPATTPIGSAPRQPSLNALRLLTDPRLFRPDAPAPAQPRRQPSSQRSALPDRPCPHALPPANQGLRPTAHQGRQEQTRDHPLP